MTHLDPQQVLALVALPDGDAERRAAYDHAASCAECRALWREHEAMLLAIDAAFAPAPISPALSAQIQARVFPKRWPRLVLLGSWLVSLLLVFMPSRELGELASALAMHCVLSESAFAAAPLGIAAWLSRAGRVRLDPLQFAVIGALAGVVGQLWLRDHCPAHGAVLHAFTFHFLGVLAISAAGAALGQRLSAAHA